MKSTSSSINAFSMPLNTPLEHIQIFDREIVWNGGAQPREAREVAKMDATLESNLSQFCPNRPFFRSLQMENWSARLDLNFPHRLVCLVRTRMPGGMAGAQPDGCPLC